MLGDTFVLPFGASTITAVKVNQDQYSSEYRFRDAIHQVIIRVRHSQINGVNGGEKRDRHNIEVTQVVFATTTEVEVQRKFYCVWEHAPSDTVLVLVDGLSDWLIASTNANAAKVHNWES